MPDIALHIDLDYSKNPERAAALFAHDLVGDDPSGLPSEWFDVVTEHLANGDTRNAKVIGVQMAKRWKTVDALLSLLPDAPVTRRDRQEIYELLLSDPMRAARHAKQCVDRVLGQRTRAIKRGK